VIGAVVSFGLLRNGSVAEWIVWCLHPAGVLAGIAWWLWLTPAPVGWIIVAVALLGSLRSPWRMQAVE